MRTLISFAGTLAFLAAAGVAKANIVHNYDDLEEGFLGSSYSSGGITYRDVNNVSGVFPDGETFVPGDLGDQLAVEDATYLYNDFPTYGSPNKALTFGSSFIPGPNLSIGALASVFMDFDQLANAASFDIAYYENGPWGGMVFHLDALRNGTVVTSDSFTIANGGGRDNPTFSTMSVSGAEFDSLHLYATLGSQYTGPRGMIDNLTVTTAPVPEPATLAALGLGALALVRRRRKNG